MPSTARPWSGLTRRLYHGVRTEGGGPGRDAAALGLGFFIGCTPFYGFHLLMVLAAGALLRLNRLKMYLAANVSNPFFAPVLVFVEIQAGAWLRRGDLHAVTLDAIRATDPWTYGADLLVGSLAIGLAGGAAIAAITWSTSRPRPGHTRFDPLAAAAADRYMRLGVVAWEFARGKLRGDPIYREAVTGGLLPPGGTLVDVGCGQGLMLALLAEVRDRGAAGEPGAPAAAPVFDSLIGVELRPKIARLAADALGSDAKILAGDARELAFPHADAILLFDVLHMLPPGDQVPLLRALVARLSPNGVVLVREAEAGAGWAFQAVRLGNTVKAIATGNWGQRFAFRTSAEWLGIFQSAGFHAAVRPMGAGTPFGNVLFTLSPSASLQPRSG